MRTQPQDRSGGLLSQQALQIGRMDAQELLIRQANIAAESSHHHGRRRQRRDNHHQNEQQVNIAAEEDDHSPGTRQDSLNADDCDDGHQIGIVNQDDETPRQENVAQYDDDVEEDENEDDEDDCAEDEDSQDEDIIQEELGIDEQDQDVQQPRRRVQAMMAG